MADDFLKTQTLSPISKLSLSFQTFSPFLEDSARHTVPTLQADDDFVFKKPPARPPKRLNLPCTNDDANDIDKENATPSNQLLQSTKCMIQTKRRSSVKRRASERSPFHLNQTPIGITTRASPDVYKPAGIKCFVNGIPNSNSNALLSILELKDGMDEGSGSPYKAPPVVKQRRASVSSPPRPDSTQGATRTKSINPLRQTTHGANSLQTTGQHTVRPRRMTHSEGDLHFHVPQLPLINISSDLNCITPETVAALIEREKHYENYNEVRISTVIQ